MATTFKVATLIVKTLVKPIANQLKKNAVHEGWFRDSCHWAGQVSNTVLTHVQLRSMGHKVKKIKPMPTDDAVKAGADLFAEGMVLSTGMVAIGIEVVRKARADIAAGIKKQEDELILREKKESKLAEKERLLREQLTRLETRMMEVENAKFATLHEKLLHEQQKHLLVTENLLKRIHFLENQLKIVTPYPLLPSHRPPSLLSNQGAAGAVVVTGQNSNGQTLGQSQSTTSPTPIQVAASTLEAKEKEQQQPSLYQSMREQTNKLFSYSSFFQTDNITPVTTTSTTSSLTNTNKQQQENEEKNDFLSEEDLMAAEADLVHHLLDTKLPEICTIITPDSCTIELELVSTGAADLIVEATTLPEEEIEEGDCINTNSKIIIKIDPTNCTEKNDENEKNGNEKNNLKNEKNEKNGNEKKSIEGDENDPFFPAIKPLSSSHSNHFSLNQPHLIEELPPSKPIPSSKAHLGVKLHV